jgi:glucose-1-phosphate cytidylyltransferase
MNTGQSSVVILCGGKGVRISAYTEHIPKPMVLIGGRPILWHVMKLYSHFGFRNFILALGYKGDKIIDYFEHYKERYCDYTLPLSKKCDRVYTTELPADENEWKITFAHTGDNTMTGGRVKRVARYIHDEHFLVTYADGVSDVNLAEVLKQHQTSGLDMTMVTVECQSNFGLVETEDGKATHFREKPRFDLRINGGFFACNRSVLDYIAGDETVLEEEPIEQLVAERKVGVYEHNGFWQCMDTPKDYMDLKALWDSGNAPWKIWE